MNGMEIRHAILTGSLDEDLQVIDDALRTRKRRIAQHTFDVVEPNVTRVAISGNLKPRYIIGATGTVVEKLEVNVVVEMDENLVIDGIDHDPYGKYAGRRIRVNPENFMVIEGDDLPAVTELAL